jgi:hypothetical protein
MHEQESGCRISRQTVAEGSRLALLGAGQDARITVWSETLQLRFHKTSCAAIYLRGWSNYFEYGYQGSSRCFGKERSFKLLLLMTLKSTNLDAR